MHIEFHEPPPAQKAGGLDQAIRSLRDHLVTNRFLVETNPPGSPGDSSVDVVHFHGLWQRRYRGTAASCRRRGIPYVVSPHGMLEPWAWRHKRWKKLPYYYAFERNFLKHAAAVLATSDQEALNLTRFAPQDRIVTIPLGVPETRGPDYHAARQRLSWGAGEVVFLYLSRIHPKKGLEHLLGALVSLADDLPPKWRCVVIGDGEEPYLSHCQQLAAQDSRIAAKVEWTGPIWGAAKWDYLQAADLFCLPSFSENFGLAILEATLVGTRVLTSPYTPWSFLTEGGAAFLVEPQVDSVKQGLLTFIRSSPWSDVDRQRLSGLMHQRFGWEAVGSQYVKLYERLVAGRRDEHASSRH